MDDMKNCMCVMMLLCLFACVDKQSESKESRVVSVSNPLTESEDVVWVEMRMELLSRLSASHSVSSPNTPNFEFNSSKELDEYNISSIPYYEYNDTVFYANPSPESIVKSLTRSPGRFWFVGKSEEKGVALMCEAVKGENGWKMRRNLNGANYFRTRLAWLWEASGDSKLRDVKLLNIYDHTYFMLIYSDKTRYYTFLGKEYTEDDFCQYLLAEKKSIDANREFFKKLRTDPEFMPKVLEEARALGENYKKRMKQ